MNFTLPELPYAYNALEPHYDEQTVRIHHDLHHKAYVDGLNNALGKLAEAREKGDFSLIKHWEKSWPSTVPVIFKSILRHKENSD